MQSKQIPAKTLTKRAAGIYNETSKASVWMPGYAGCGIWKLDKKGE